MRIDPARRGRAHSDGPTVGANKCTRYRGPDRVDIVYTPIDDDPTGSVDPVPESGHVVAVVWIDSRGYVGRTLKGQSRST